MKLIPNSRLVPPVPWRNHALSSEAQYSARLYSSPGRGERY
jgi:hypothetical protein